MNLAPPNPLAYMEESAGAFRLGGLNMPGIVGRCAERWPGQHVTLLGFTGQGAVCRVYLIHKDKEWTLSFSTGSTVYTYYAIPH